MCVIIIYHHYTVQKYTVQVQWATSLFGLAFRWAFRWAKVRSKTWLKSKSEVISLSLSLSKRLRRKVRSKYRLRPKLSRTNLTEVGRICMEEIAEAFRA